MKYYYIFLLLTLFNANTFSSESTTQSNPKSKQEKKEPTAQTSWDSLFDIGLKPNLRQLTLPSNIFDLFDRCQKLANSVWEKYPQARWSMFNLSQELLKSHNRFLEYKKIYWKIVDIILPYDIEGTLEAIFTSNEKMFAREAKTLETKKQEEYKKYWSNKDEKIFKELAEASKRYIEIYQIIKQAIETFKKEDAQQCFGGTPYWNAITSLELVESIIKTISIPPTMIQQAK